MNRFYVKVILESNSRACRLFQSEAQIRMLCSSVSKVTKLLAQSTNLRHCNFRRKIIKNRSSQTQTTSYTVSRTVTETSSFSHTAGASVTIGTTFSVGVPFIAKGEVSVSATASYSYTTGMFARLPLLTATLQVC